MSINPLLNPESLENKSLNLYCNTITTSQGQSSSRVKFEPQNIGTLNYNNPESCQGSQGPFNFLLEEDDTSATIYGQYRAQGTNKDAVFYFKLPTSHSIEDSNNICVLGSGRSIDINGNSNGNVFNIYECDIFETSPGNYVLRTFWRSFDNTDDPVNDFKYFRFMATYKK